ncbi:MAG: hypothetical protein M3203_05900 [Actinomycetota bacterium]|nr:hypothetical protein [Actinomycetota bacterium]
MVRPLGYPVFLRLLSPTGHIAAVPVTQHLLGLATAGMVYLLLRRLGARPGLAALGVAPVLLDPSQIYLEQFVMAETLFEFLVVGGLAMLLWRDRPSLPLSAGAGVLVAAAALTRTVGLLLLVPATAYLLVRRIGVKPVLSMLAGAAILIVPYGMWFASHHGHFGLEAYRGYFLAGRVLPFADCASLELSDVERLLCDDRPPEQRPGPNAYVWGAESQLRHWAVPEGSDRNSLALDFAQRVIRHQPGDYLGVVARETLHYFAPGRTGGPHDFPVEVLEFATSFPPNDTWWPLHPPSDPYVWHWTWPGPAVADSVILAKYGFDLSPASPEFNPRLASYLRHYQRLFYFSGPVLAVFLLVGVFGGLGRLSAGQDRLRWAAVVLAGSGVLLVVAAAATSLFDYRYLVPALPLIPAGGAVGLCLLQQRARTAGRE